MSQAMTSAIRMRTNAKINLFLRVMGQRPDGFHEIETIFHGVGLKDDIVLTPTTSGEVEIEMQAAGNLRADMPTFEENLAWLAARALIEQGSQNAGVHISITKRIPVAAGLGGGSGNAAGVLVGLNELWEFGLDRSGLLELAGVVGSDVPYCIDGGTALATGKGEALTALPFPSDLWLVLGISYVPLLTREVYAAWEPSDSKLKVGSAPMTLALGAGDVPEVAALLHNDLEPAIFKLRPELEDKKQELLQAGALGALVSGSGPTVYGVAGDRAHAEAIAASVKSEFDEALVLSTSKECIERIG
jgi:4-diphosphocytidyl-2-C-methyl-D-erythritol kinase